MQVSMTVTWRVAGAVLLALSLLAAVCDAKTGSPSVTSFGWDDYNTSTLNPVPAQFLNATPAWFNQALPNAVGQPNLYQNSYANAAQWTFTFAGAAVPAGDLTATNYLAWVVKNDAYNLPDGTPAVLRTVTGDVGGADYSLTYAPGAADPGGPGNAIALANVHFLQVLQITANFGNDATGVVTSTQTTNQIDNLANVNTPFYDVAGGANGTWTPMGGNPQKYLDDTPYTTEDSGGYGNGQSDTAPILLSETDLFATFIAVDMGANGNTQNNVLLYGGQSWSYTYSDTDVPEPGALALLASAAIGALLYAWRERRAA